MRLPVTGGHHAPSVAVVGGGILGTTLALRLTQMGARVTLLERAPTLGGLAGTMDFGGHQVDRFYHVILPSDDRMLALAAELGLADEIRFSPVGVGFFLGGSLYPFNGLADFARFPPLSPLQRMRLAWFVAQCQVGRRGDKLEDLPLEPWLKRHCGRAVVDAIWRPLLDSRFDGRHEELPATYLWSRTRRMRSARTDRGAGETMGCLPGGHDRLIEAVAARARALGAVVRVGAAVDELVLDERGGVQGLRVNGAVEEFDLTVATLQPPALRRLLPDVLTGLLDPYPQRYLGVVCLVLKMRRTLLPYYSVNICDPTPMTTVVEASHVVGTEHTDGLRLLYLPKYCEADAPEHTEDPASVYARFTTMLARIAPDFRHEDVVDWTLQRSPLVEPVHALGVRPRVAPFLPDVNGLAFVSASQIYPRLLNGDSSIRLAEEALPVVGERLGLLV